MTQAQQPAAPNFGGIDFSQYRNWQVVRTPTGGTYYAVPGTAFVYDPFLSAARGQTVVYRNPTQRLEEEQRVRDAQDRQQRLQERAASPEGQIIPVAGGVAGTVGGAYLINQINQPSAPSVSPTPTTPTPPAANSSAASGSMVNPGTVAQPTAPAPIQTPGQAFTSGAMGPQPAPQASSMAPVVENVQVVPAGQPVPEGFTAVGSAADGSGAQIAVPTDQIPADGGIQFGEAAQGILAGAQLYGGYRAIQDGDYLGGGLGLVGGGANLAASGVLGSGIQAAAQDSLGGYLLPGVNLATGLYTGYRTMDAIGDMAQGGARNRMGVMGGAGAGAAIGTAILPGVGTAIGAGVGALVGWGASLAGSGKDKYQMIRDKGRDFLQEKGILDENYQGTLADGTKFDFGRDGKKYGKPQFDNPLYDQAAAFGNVLASVEGMSGRGREAMSMLYSNAAVSNAGKDPATVLNNYRHFAQQRGITLEQAQAQLQRMRDEKQISDHEFEVYSNDARQIFAPSSQAPKAPMPAAPAPAPAPGAPVQISGPTTVSAQPNKGPARSKTLSPGIGLDGQRLGQQLAQRINRRPR